MQSLKPAYKVKFSSKLFRVPGKGGWTFAPVPKKYLPRKSAAWGRYSVTAVVDVTEWKTSIWKEKNGRGLLPVPKSLRGDKGEGSSVNVKLTFYDF